MGEENKRLVAYVEDLYEDLRGNNMVVVRWFHKVDEVSILLPPDVSDREIFFSLCLQHLCVECIDGLASVLSPQHFELFLNDGKSTKCEPYMCSRQVDNDDVKSFDVTQVQGYWSQELLRSLFTSPLKFRFKIKHGSSDAAGARRGDISESGCRRNFQLQSQKNSIVENLSRNKTRFRNSISSGTSGKQVRSTLVDSASLKKELFKHKFQPQLSRGCHVEVFSQDSGLRGCWFHCVVLKRHQDKVKVRYEDVKNFDETDNLEEWISLSRVASPDKMGIRLCGRPMVRPYRTHRGLSWSILEIGAIVDAWWHDGWWEGVLVNKEDGLLQVYFPGEGRYSVFSQNDLRESQDWVNEKWNLIESRKDIAISPLTEVKSDNKCMLKQQEIHIDPINQDSPIIEPGLTQSRDDKVQEDYTTSPDSCIDQEGCWQDLTKDWRFDSLKWSSMKKRKRAREVAKKAALENKRLRKSGSGKDMEEPRDHGNLLLPKSLSVDHENCKIGGDALFGAPMPLSNLVMSR